MMRWVQTISRRAFFALSSGALAASVAAPSLIPPAAPALPFKGDWHPSDDGLVLCRVWEHYPYRGQPVLIRSAYVPSPHHGRLAYAPGDGQPKTFFILMAEDRADEGGKIHTTCHYEYESGPKWWQTGLVPHEPYSLGSFGPVSGRA